MIIKAQQKKKKKNKKSPAYLIQAKKQPMDHRTPQRRRFNIRKTRRQAFGYFLQPLAWQQRCVRAAQTTLSLALEDGCRYGA